MSRSSVPGRRSGTVCRAMVSTNDTNAGWCRLSTPSCRRPGSYPHFADLLKKRQHAEHGGNRGPRISNFRATPFVSVCSVLALLVFGVVRTFRTAHTAGLMPAGKRQHGEHGGNRGTTDFKLSVELRLCPWALC